MLGPAKINIFAQKLRSSLHDRPVSLDTLVDNFLIVALGDLGVNQQLTALNHQILTHATEHIESILPSVYVAIFHEVFEIRRPSIHGINNRIYWLSPLERSPGEFSALSSTTSSASSSM